MNADCVVSIDPSASYQQAQRQLAQLFEAAGSDVAMIEARILLCAALNIDHAALLRDAERPIGAEGAEAVAKLAALAARRVKHEPVSRILGRREFWGLDLAIDACVLDPRADTETIVEAVIDAMASRWQTPLRLLDLGTGSGALLCALLASFPQAFGVGIDLSEAACRVAAKNLAALGLASRGKIVCGHWAEALCGRFDIIVSNPPYIAHAEIETLAPEVRDYDPHLALDGGADGFLAYRSLSPELPRLLAKEGVAVFEVGLGQAERVARLLEAAGSLVIGMRRDLAGIERVVVAKSG
jgi:release factor glutamine methyltransferase